MIYGVGVLFDGEIRVSAVWSFTRDGNFFTFFRKSNRRMQSHIFILYFVELPLSNVSCSNIIAIFFEESASIKNEDVEQSWDYQIFSWNAHQLFAQNPW